MFTLIRDGGFPVWFVLAFGIGAVAVALGYAAKRTRSLGLLYGLAGATLFSTLSATCADFGATFAHVSGQMEQTLGDPKAPAVEWARVAAPLLGGAGESLSPGILGFSFLSVSCLLVGIGKHRRALDEEV
jgi:hypothetical protein